MSNAVRWARSVPRALGATALLGALATGTAAAQTLSRPGFWMDAGVSYGRLRLTCDTGCARIVAVNGPAYTVTVGGAVSQNVLLGVEGQSWVNTGGATQQVRSVTAVVQWYPWPAAKFFVRGGVGIVQSTVSLTADTTGAHTAKGSGVALTVSAGYDFRVTQHFGVAVQAATHVAALGDLAVGGAVSNTKGVIAYVSRIGVALVYR